MATNDGHETRVPYRRRFLVAYIMVPIVIVIVIGGRLYLRSAGVAHPRNTSVAYKDTAFTLYRVRDQRRDQIVRNRATIGTNDALRIAYQTATATRGVVFSINDAGTVREFFPAGGAGELEDRARVIVTPTPYVPSSPSSAERFFFVFATSETHFDATEIIRIANELSVSPETAIAEAKTAFGDYKTLAVTVFRK